jgi:hypothetical protein
LLSRRPGFLIRGKTTYRFYQVRLLAIFAPFIERMSKLPKGSIRGFADSMETDAIGDPSPIRAILPRPPLPYRQAVEKALKEKS